MDYETFESSSGEENTQVVFESEANSFQNRAKQVTSAEREAKRIERQKRKYRKLDEKVRALKDEERAKKKRKTAFLRKLDKLPLKESQQEDVLQFDDSDREEVMEYFRKRALPVSIRPIDTPTRILGNSNEFLPRESIELPRKNAADPGILTPRKELRHLKEKL